VKTDSKWRKRAAVVATCGMLSVGPVVAVAPSAQAVTACSPGADGESFNTRTIALPNKPDMIVDVELCLYNHVGSYQGIVKYSWRSTTGGDGFGTKFNDFVAVGWVQKNNHNKCRQSSTPSVNSNASGSGLVSCSWHSANTGGVTTDGQIVYDVANDGKAPHTWNLTGTHDV
jgi:hypothetical protein